jgi:hypothetical protein
LGTLIIMDYPVIYISHITRADCKNNPKVLFAFGDNDIHKGYGGLAKEVRGEPNAVGIRVKKKPWEPGAYYTDEEYEDNCAKISHDVHNLVSTSGRGYYVAMVFPAAGIGTGLAQMKERCPKTFDYLNKKLAGFGIRNGII